MPGSRGILIIGTLPDASLSRVSCEVASYGKPGEVGAPGFLHALGLRAHHVGDCAQLAASPDQAFSRIRLSRESGLLENQVEQMGEVFLQVAPIHNQIHESFLHQEF